MANWQYRLDIKDIWQRAARGEILPYQLAHGIAERMKQLNIQDDDFQQIMDDFATLPAEDYVTFDDTDDIMEALYDWGDTTLPPYSVWPRHKMCWIATS
jgi:hypothetical protein